MDLTPEVENKVIRDVVSHKLYTPLVNPYDRIQDSIWNKLCDTLCNQSSSQVIIEGKQCCFECKTALRENHVNR